MKPQPAPLRLFLWNLKPLLPPDALYPLVIDPPAQPSQKGRDPTITVATILTGQPDNVRCQGLLITFDNRFISLG